MYKRLAVCLLVFMSGLLISSCDKNAGAPSPSVSPTAEVGAVTNVVPVETALAVLTPANLPSAASPSPPPVLTANLNGVVIVTDGLLNPMRSAWKGDGALQEWYDELNSRFNVTITFDALNGKRADIPAEIARSVAAGTPAADLVLVTRTDMAAMALDGTIEDITGGVLSYGLPEPYYTAGWLKNRLYGFSDKPPVEGAFLIYNKEMLSDLGIEVGPGEMFDGGTWSWRDFLEYCLMIEEKIEGKIGNNAENSDKIAVAINESEWLYNGAAANGGFVFNPISGLPAYGTSAVSQTLSFLKELAGAGLINHPARGRAVDEDVEKAFVNGNAAIISGNAESLIRYAGQGMNIGAVPYPWGPSITLNANYDYLENMLLGGYKPYTDGADSEVFVLVKGSALSKASVPDYIDLVFGYNALRYSEMSVNRDREQRGQGMASSAAKGLRAFVDAEDAKRLEWLLGLNAVYGTAPENITERLLINTWLDTFIGSENSSWEWLRGIYPHDLEYLINSGYADPLE